jgi:hypothetical protein
MKNDQQDKEYDVLLDNVRSILSTRQGREFVWWILSQSDFYSDPPEDPVSCNRVLGRQSLGRDVLYLLEHADPTAYPKLLLEKITEEDEK